MKIEIKNKDDFGCGAIIICLAIGSVFGAGWGWVLFGVFILIANVRITTK